jgi:hypothetical protein
MNDAGGQNKVIMNDAGGQNKMRMKDAEWLKLQGLFQLSVGN